MGSSRPGGAAGNGVNAADTVAAAGNGANAADTVAAVGNRANAADTVAMIEPAAGAGSQVKIYTDGACSGNPGPGGWGAVLLWREEERTLQGGEKETTNNRMELTAAIKALEALKRPCRAEVYSDSAYLINAFLQGWLAKWQRNGWLTAKKEPVENRDLWLRLLELAGVHAITWRKVKGHSDNPYNNRCDAMAVEEAAKFKNLCP